MDKKVVIGIVEFILLAAIMIGISILLSFISFFILPIMYLVAFVFMFKGSEKARVIIVILNILSAFAYNSITLSVRTDHLLRYFIHLVIPLVLVMCSFALYFGNIKAFMIYQKQKYCQK